MEEHRRRVDLWRASGVPSRHRERIEAGMTYSAWSEPEQAAVRRAAKIVQDGGLLTLVGNRGTGKTLLAAWLIYGCCMAWGRPAMYRRFADLMSEVRKEAYSDGGSDAVVIRRLSRLGLLVIDELHERRWSDDEQLWLVRLLDHRYGEKLPTVLVANLTGDALMTALGPSVIDRMREGGAVVELVGESKRGAQP